MCFLGGRKKTNDAPIFFIKNIWGKNFLSSSLTSPSLTEPVHFRQDLLLLKAQANLPGEQCVHFFKKYIFGKTYDIL